jgi:peptide/nickel transport system ATP-binding protein
MSAAALEIVDLNIAFGGARPVAAVAGCNLSVSRGEVVALVGESGSGKSTLARAAAGLVRPSSGRILIDGHDMADVGRAQARALRRRVQMVFQNPDASLNPHHRIGTALREPLVVRGMRDGAAINERVRELLAMVRLDAALLDRRPRELSGGQKQRVAIARALAMEPTLLIADEALAALDLSTQATIGALLSELRTRLGLAILFISHDLGMVGHLADRIAIMRQGRILESGQCRAVLANPSHRYTRHLIDATPNLARGGLDLDHFDEDLDAEGMSV